jgi:uncharacterized repeat protein (TIGR03943 family)
VKRAGGAISILVGVVLLRLTVTGTYERYVGSRMGIWLMVAGVTVIALGVITFAAPERAGAGDPHGHHHDHDHGPRVGWLLLAPIAALLLVAPPTLGSYGVDRSASVDVRAGRHSVFSRLPKGAPPVPMTLLEFGERAFDHRAASFRGVPVELTGFVAGSEAGGFRLARYQIACCAADAQPVVVRVVGTLGDPPTRDQWVRVTGTVRPNDGELPELSATSVVAITAPTDPYE